MIELADSDEDGLVSFADFLEIMTIALGGQEGHFDFRDEEEESKGSISDNDSNQ